MPLRLLKNYVVQYCLHYTSYDEFFFFYNMLLGEHFLFKNYYSFLYKI